MQRKLISVIDITFDAKTVLESEASQRCIEDCCGKDEKQKTALVAHLTQVVSAFQAWIENYYHLPKDIYWSHDNLPETSGDWDCDNDEGDWESARMVMKTSQSRFGLEESPFLMETAKWFQALGFKVLNCCFTSWGKGYDYDIEEVDMLVWKLEKVSSEYQYLCIIFPIESCTQRVEKREVKSKT